MPSKRYVYVFSDTFQELNQCKVNKNKTVLSLVFVRFVILSRLKINSQLSFYTFPFILFLIIDQSS